MAKIFAILTCLALSGCADSVLGYIISGPNLRSLYEHHEPTPTYPAKPNQKVCP